MASDFLRFQQDPSLGNALSGIIADIGAAPGKALSNTMTVEQILALREKQRQDKIQFEEQTLAGNAAAAALAGVGPRTSTREVQFQPQGPVDPSVDPATIGATKLGDTMVMPSYATKEEYVDPKVKAQYDRELPMFQAAARAEARRNAGGVPGMYSRGAIGLGGAPTDPAEMQRLSGITTGTVAPLKGDNYVAISKDGSAVPLGTSPDGVWSADGRSKLVDIAPPGAVVMKAGERGITPSASDNTVKTWAIPGPDNRPLPGSLISSVNKPSDRHVLSTPLSSAPGDLKTWVLRDKTGRIVPNSEVTAVSPPNSNFVQAGAASLTPGEPKVWVKTDENGRAVGAPVTSVEQPEGYTLSTAVKPEASDRVGTPAERQGLLAEFADKVITKKYELTTSDAVKLAFALNSEYGLTNKLQADARGNIVKFTGFQEKDIPQGPHAMLARAVNTTLAPLYAGPDGTATPGQQTQAPVNALNPPPMGTQVVSAGEANQNMANKAQAIGRADVAQRNLETRMGFVDGQPPAIFYVPNLAAAIIAEGNHGMVGGRAISMIDPKAPGYLADAKSWVEAVLRLASGAAIRPEEYADYAQIFIPNANDNREQVLAKVQRMNDWKQITATAMNAEDAFKMLSNVKEGDPVFKDMAVKMRNMAEANGHLTTRFDDPNFGKPKAAGGPDANTVNTILNGGRL